MTVASVNSRISYAGSGISTFSYPYEFKNLTDIGAALQVVSTGAITPLTYGVDYTVSGTQDPVTGFYLGGGSVVTTVAVPSGTNIVLFRTTPALQGLSVTQAGNFPSKPFEAALDNLALATQRAVDLSTRAMHLPDGFATTFDTTLPSNLGVNPNCAIISNASGDGFAVGPTADEIANAQTNATNAAASASSASASAASASTSASTASTAATNASASATAAGTSATNAAASATSASGSATSAGTSATNAAASATSASGSATTATTQAGNASTSATNAANSATSASTSATNAGNSATAAATSATNAGNSATAAAASAAASYGLATYADDASYVVAHGAAVQGAEYFNTTSKKIRYYNNSAWSDVGSGSGGSVNFIGNPDAETDTSGWATYADAAGTSPVDGTGGAPTVTFTRSTSAPLFGTASFLFTKDAANRQGQGASYAFSIDSGYQARVHQVEFDYILNSGAFVAGSSSTDSDMEVYLYDVTNAALIPLSTYKLFSNSSGVSAKFIGNFQAPYNSTSYRLIFHCASTSASAYVLKIDNVKVGPSIYAFGTPITDWKAYTPTLGAGFGTATGISFLYRRVGDCYEVMGSFTTGTIAASLGTISLPNGASIDSTKISVQNTTGNPGVEVGQYDTTAASTSGPILTATGTAANVVYTGSNYGAISHLTPTNVSSPFSSSQFVSIYFYVPILGLSSTVQMSDSADQRICVASMSGAGSSAASAAVITLPTIDFDTHGAITSGQFKAPTSGYYEVAVHLQANATIAYATYLNGVIQKRFCISDASGGDASGSHIVKASAGDLIDVRPTATSGAFNVNSFIQFQKVQGPDTIGATETIAASYYTSANCTATTAINFDTKIHDTHGAVTASAAGTGAWRFTAPARGLYRVSGTVALTVGANGAISLAKNGSTLMGYVGYITNNNGVGSYVAEVYLNAGDYIWVFASTGTAAGAALSAASSNIAISRVGI